MNNYVFRLLLLSFSYSYYFSPLFPIHSVEAEVMSMKSVLPADQAIASPRLHLSMSFFLYKLCHTCDIFTSFLSLFCLQNRETKICGLTCSSIYMILDFFSNIFHTSSIILIVFQVLLWKSFFALKVS